MRSEILALVTAALLISAAHAQNSVCYNIGCQVCEPTDDPEVKVCSKCLAGYHLKTPENSCHACQVTFCEECSEVGNCIKCSNVSTLDNDGKCIPNEVATPEGDPKQIVMIVISGFGVLAILFFVYKLVQCLRGRRRPGQDTFNFPIRDRPRLQFDIKNRPTTFSVFPKGKIGRAHV